MDRVVDTMAVTSTIANTNIQQLGEAFVNVASVSSSFGVSIEQTSALLGIMADAGKKGADAGTHLKIILGRLANNSDSQKAMKELERVYENEITFNINDLNEMAAGQIAYVFQMIKSQAK